MSGPTVTALDFPAAETTATRDGVTDADGLPLETVASRNGEGKAMTLAEAEAAIRRIVPRGDPQEREQRVRRYQARRIGETCGRCDRTLPAGELAFVSQVSAGRGLLGGWRWEKAFVCQACVSCWRRIRWLPP